MPKPHVESESPDPREQQPRETIQRPRVRLGGSFQLTDHFGESVTDDTYHGQYVLIFFGFTHCRVVCPRALAKISQALDSIGSLAAQVQPLYITVDPARDTPEVMRAFLEERYPRFIGLTGTREQIDAAKSAFHVFARRREGDGDPDGYAVPHTAFTFLMGPNGVYLTHFTDTVNAEEMAQRLRALLRITSAEGRA